MYFIHKHYTCRTYNAMVQKNEVTLACVLASSQAMQINVHTHCNGVQMTKLIRFFDWIFDM